MPINIEKRQYTHLYKKSSLCILTVWKDKIRQGVGAGVVKTPGKLCGTDSQGRSQKSIIR